MMRKINAVLINDTDGRVNIGCNLTSQGLKNELFHSFRKKEINLSIKSIPYLFGKNKEDINRA
jgi:hypothetical protein